MAKLKGSAPDHHTSSAIPTKPQTSIATLPAAAILTTQTINSNKNFGHFPKNTPVFNIFKRKWQFIQKILGDSSARGPVGLFFGEGGEITAPIFANRCARMYECREGQDGRTGVRRIVSYLIITCGKVVPLSRFCGRFVLSPTGSW